MKKNAIKVEQRFGPFYVVKFTASELLELAYSEPLRRENDQLIGNQRLIDEKRRKSIRKYINSSDSAFPNSIILAANFSKDGNGQVEENDELRWKITENTEELFFLEIPTNMPMAVIIDGQHRLMGFKDAELMAKDMELICSVYLDLPSSMQAFLFATINSTQKPVDKSLAYELFGYDLDNESPDTWSPDKLAISLCRKLNNDPPSPFYEHIKPGSIMDMPVGNDGKWRVSTSCIVDNILHLISTNPKDDKTALYKFGEKKRYRIKLIDERKDHSPLRELYLKSHDGVIYNIICNFFKSAMTVLHESFVRETALNKTIGIQGLFDVLRIYITFHKDVSLKEIDFTKDAFDNIFRKSLSINFGQDVFMKFSGVGRARVRDAILVSAKIKKSSEIQQSDFREWVENNISLN